MKCIGLFRLSVVVLHEMPFDKRFITVICLLVFILLKYKVMHINRHTDTRYSYTKRVKGSHAMARE